jgi:hypothetical protein
MKLSDFRSNDAVQLSLVHYIDQAGAHRGKKYSYRNKRTQSADRNKISIKMDEFCRTLYAYQFGPVDMHGGQAHLYDTGIDGGYPKLFGRDLAALSQQEFERLFGIWLMCSHAEGQLKNEKTSTDLLDDSDIIRRRALERKYLTFCALGEVIRGACRLQKIEEGDFLRNFGKPRWQEEDKILQFIEEAFGLALDMVVQAYQMAQRDPAFVHRNFFRSNDTQVSIHDALASRRRQLQHLSESLPYKSQATYNKPVQKRSTV